MGFFSFLQSLFCQSKDEKIEGLNDKLEVLQEQLDCRRAVKEDYYNNKYPKKNLRYARTEIDGQNSVDLRNFFTLNDSIIPVVDGANDDIIALNGLKWVIGNITYTSDNSESTYKSNEYWAYPYQTLKHRMGDCEDGAILLANILIRSGVPYWKVRLMAGDVVGGGHCYVTYYCSKADKWVLLDWCYYPNTLPVEERKDYKDEANYKTVWFSWNRDYCFSAGKDVTVNNYFTQLNSKKKKL